MIDRIFLSHPRSVGESYVTHAATAFGFGARMIGGGIACLVHGLVPALFPRTARRSTAGCGRASPFTSSARRPSRSPAGSSNTKSDPNDTVRAEPVEAR